MAQKFHFWEYYSTDTCVQRLWVVLVIYCSIIYNLEFKCPNQSSINQSQRSHALEYYTAVKKTAEAFYVRHGVEHSVEYGNIWKKGKTTDLTASVCALNTSEGYKRNSLRRKTRWMRQGWDQDFSMYIHPFGLFELLPIQKDLKMKPVERRVTPPFNGFKMASVSPRYRTPAAAVGGPMLHTQRKPESRIATGHGLSG